MTDAVGKRIAPSGGRSTVARRRGRPNWGSATVVVLAAMFAVFLALPIVVLIARSILSGALAAVAGSSAIVAALALSLATTSVSLALAIAFGLPLAFVLARRSFRGKWLVEAIVDLPIVLPPAVAGLALLLVFGRRGVLAGPMQAAGMDIAFTTIAVILAQTFVSAPFFVRSARAGIAGVDRDLEDAGPGRRRDRAPGCSATSPCRSPARCSPRGLVMTWARALGEFGATIMFAGNVEGRTQTLPLVVYAEFQAGNLDTSIAARGDPRLRRARRARVGAVLPLGKGPRRSERRLIDAERPASQTSGERPPNRPRLELSRPLERSASQMSPERRSPDDQSTFGTSDEPNDESSGGPSPIESVSATASGPESTGPRHPARARRSVG